MLALLHQLFDPAPATEIGSAIYELDLETFRVRGSLTIGHAVVSSSVSAGGMLSLLTDEGRPFLTFKAPTGLECGWSGLLTIDIIATLEPSGLYWLIFRDKELIRASSLLTDAPVPDILKTPMISRTNRREVHRVAEELLRSVLAHPEIAGIREYLRLDQVASDIFLPFALPFSSDTTLDDVVAALSKKGIRSILQEKQGLLLDAARLSIMIALFNAVDDDEAAFSWESGSPVQVAQQVNDYLRPMFGKDVFIVHEHKVIFSLL
jgi:hypothetical protein